MQTMIDYLAEKGLSGCVCGFNCIMFRFNEVIYEARSIEELKKIIEGEQK